MEGEIPFHPLVLSSVLSFHPMRHFRLLIVLGTALAVPAGLTGCGGQTQANQTPLALTVEHAAAERGNVAVVLTGSGVEELRKFLGETPDAAQVEEVLSLSVAPKPSQPAPVPILARLRWEGGRAVLQPQVSLTRGQSYVARFHGSRVGHGLPELTQEYQVPVDNSPSETRVTGVYPQQVELPANLLKFYVHFTLPMGEGQVFKYVRLLDGEGQPIAQAFHEQELWEDNHRRLTLLINPGRTKRALGLSEALGPVLMPGRAYTLEIGKGLPDAHGWPLAETVRHRFKTGEFDREQPHVTDWKMTAPDAGRREALTVRFPEPLDHSLAQRVLGVERAGEVVPGQASLTEDSRTWSFVPEQPWGSGKYRLVAEGLLEDLAGNSLLRPFETATERGTHPVVTPPAFEREFMVK